MRPIAVRSTVRLLAEDLVPVPEPLTLALQPGQQGTPGEVIAGAARALLDLPEVAPSAPSWLAPHQVPAFSRLCGLIGRYGGALLADAVGLGKSYVALAVALELTGLKSKFGLVVPAVLVPQWKRLLEEKGAGAEIFSHEGLRTASRFSLSRSSGGLLIVDEAHRFRNPETQRYQRLAELCVGRRVLLVTATPVHNRLADLFLLFRLFLRDDALTALGVSSLLQAARGKVSDDVVRAVAARLVVSRSRRRAPARFPSRQPATVIGEGTAPTEILQELVTIVGSLRLGGSAAALLRISLLRRLASSVPAFSATVERCRAFVDLAAEAAAAGRRLEPGDFQRLFPRTEGPDLQLTLLPLLLEADDSSALPDDARALDGLVALARVSTDPKADALEHLLERGGKTIVFTESVDTARYLRRRLSRRLRVAAVSGDAGWFGSTRVSPQEVFAAFAPGAQGAATPPRALETDVLVATDLASEGLNLQDAERVIHYDMPWSPARLAQRVGRIDRLGSPHSHIVTVSFVPPAVIDQALCLERRLASKLQAQALAGTAQRESPIGAESSDAPLDWCDELQELVRAEGNAGWAHVRSDRFAAVLAVRLGAFVESFVVEDGVARAAPDRATALFYEAVRGEAAACESERLEAAVRIAAPAIRTRLRALQTARWRAEDRDRLARRLIPWVLAAARRAAREGNAAQLRRLDDLVSRLTRGLTAGEEFGLRELVERREPLAVRDLLAWHEQLPQLEPWPDAPQVELVAAVVFASPPSQG